MRDLCFEHDGQPKISHGEGLNTPGSCKDQNLEGKSEKLHKRYKNPNLSQIFDLAIKIMFKCLLMTDLILFSDLSWLIMNL